MELSLGTPPSQFEYNRIRHTPAKHISYASQLPEVAGIYGEFGTGCDFTQNKHPMFLIVR